MMLRSLYKKTQIVTIIMATLALLSLQVSAVTLTPSSQFVSESEQVSINITASPSEAASAVELRISVSNGTLLSYDPPAGRLSIGVCDIDNTQSFTSTTVCVDITSGTFTNGDDLGTMIIQVGSTGSTTITKDTGNQYTLVSDGSREVDTGVAGTFTISEELPDTSIVDENPMIFAGIGIFSLGVFLMKVRKNSLVNN